MFESMSVDDDVKTMEMTGTSTFLGDFLADQMLRDSGAAMQNVSVSSSHQRGGGGHTAAAAAATTKLVQA